MKRSETMIFRLFKPLGFTVLFSLFCLLLPAQNVVLSGRVTDSTTGEPLIGVSVYNSQRRTGTTTNATGYYTLTLPSNRALELVFSYVGYASYSETLTLTGNRQLNVELKQDTQNLREVQVYGTRHNFGAQSSQMSTIAISAEQIRQMPTLFGEVDVLKTLQKLPGVQSSGDGKTGIYVRGGDYDQNLFLMDGITLYNPEHLQGFTSAFNADVLDDVVLYKGAFPARYGNRLSSVVDVSLQEGDMEKYHATLTAGMLASHVQVDGPLWKGHTSFNIAARVSYFGAIVRPLLKEVIYDNPGQMDNYSHMNYFDLNAKLTHRFGKKDKLSAVFYMGHDANNDSPDVSSQKITYSEINGNGIEETTVHEVSMKSQQVNQWNNLLGGLHYTHTFTPGLLFDASMSYSGYEYKLGYESSTSHKVSIDAWGHQGEGAELYSLSKNGYTADYISEVHDWQLRLGVGYQWQDKHDFYAGIQGNSMELTPNIGSKSTMYVKKATSKEVVKETGLGQDRYYEEGNADENTLIDKERLTTLAAYVGDDWSVSPRLKAHLGLRFAVFSSEGKARFAVEPRVSMRWLVTKEGAVKAGYSRMSQNIFMLTSSSLVNPSSVWIPLTDEMDLGTSEQVSLGYSHDLLNGLQFSLEGYYKWLDGVVDYKEGSSFMQESHWQRLVAQGKGRAYGIELLVQKNIGNTTGLLSYTWAKSLRTFDREGMELNEGLEFYAPGDRRHNFNITITQRLSKNWDFSAAWTYQSGRRAHINTVTVTNGQMDTQSYHQSDQYEQDTFLGQFELMNTYQNRNSFIFPAAHRLDVSLTHHGSIGIGEMICDISLYNLYNQQNISSVYWGIEHNRQVLKGVCMFPIMPAISLTIKL